MSQNRDPQAKSALASPLHQARTQSRPMVPAIVKTSRGVANGVQQTYARWERGIRKP